MSSMLFQLSTFYFEKFTVTPLQYGVLHENLWNPQLHACFDTFSSRERQVEMPKMLIILSNLLVLLLAGFEARSRLQLDLSVQESFLEFSCLAESCMSPRKHCTSIYFYQPIVLGCEGFKFSRYFLWYTWIVALKISTRTNTLGHIESPDSCWNHGWPSHCAEGQASDCHTIVAVWKSPRKCAGKRGTRESLCHNHGNWHTTRSTLPPALP